MDYPSGDLFYKPKSKRIRFDDNQTFGKATFQKESMKNGNKENQSYMGGKFLSPQSLNKDLMTLNR